MSIHVVLQGRETVRTCDGCWREVEAALIIAGRCADTSSVLAELIASERDFGAVYHAGQAGYRADGAGHA